MTDVSASVRLRALLMLVIANAFWGLSFPVIKAIGLLHHRLLPGVGTWFSVIYTVAPRFVLGSAVLIVLRPRNVRQVTRGEWTQGVIIGLFLAGGVLLQNDGLQFTTGSTAG